MKVDFNKKFRDYKGNELGIIIADKVAEALYSAGATQELAIKREDKFRAYKLCQIIMGNNGVIDITSEDATLIKDICANYLTAGAYGQIYELIEKGTNQ